MKVFLFFAIAIPVSVFSSPIYAAQEFASAKEAETLVTKALKHIKSVGKNKAYADFTEKKAGWVDRDLYVVVYDFQGKVLAHGQNPKMVGKELIELVDIDGKPFVKERVLLAQSCQMGKFWQDYKFVDPVTKRVLPKTMYCERLEETAVCAGIYKR
ncbi:MAG: cache domain-containing protein [Pseudomonadota bacterium]